MSHQKMMCQTTSKLGFVMNHDIDIIEGPSLDVNPVCQEVPPDGKSSGQKRRLTHVAGKFGQGVLTPETLLWSEEQLR